MRVLAIEPGPEFSVADVHNGWVRALRNLGCEVYEFDFGNRLEFYTSVAKFSTEQAIGVAAQGIRTAAFDFWPDVVLVTTGVFVPSFTYEVLRARGMKTVMLLTESPYEDPAQIARAHIADLVLINDPTNLDGFREVNPNTHYMPHAYDPDVHHPRAPELEFASDFCFVGTGFPSRVEFFEQVHWSDIDVALAGNWQGTRIDSPLRSFMVHPLDHCLDNADAARMYASTKASVNFYRRESQEGQSAQGWAMGPREVELAACGTFFLTEERGENREVLPMVPTFEGSQDFEQQLRWYLANDSAREEVALKAREAISDRTFESNAAALLNRL